MPPTQSGSHLRVSSTEMLDIFFKYCLATEITEIPRRSFFDNIIKKLGPAFFQSGHYIGPLEEFVNARIRNSQLFCFRNFLA